MHSLYSTDSYLGGSDSDVRKMLLNKTNCYSINNDVHKEFGNVHQLILPKQPQPPSKYAMYVAGMCYTQIECTNHTRLDGEQHQSSDVPVYVQPSWPAHHDHGLRG